MELLDKLTILADAAKYDAACTSSGAKRGFQEVEIPEDVTVGDTLDALKRDDVFVTRQFHKRIFHCLIGKAGAKKHRYNVLAYLCTVSICCFAPPAAVFVLMAAPILMALALAVLVLGIVGLVKMAFG